MQYKVQNNHYSAIYGIFSEVFALKNFLPHVRENGLSATQTIIGHNWEKTDYYRVLIL